MVRLERGTESMAVKQEIVSQFVTAESELSFHQPVQHFSQALMRRDELVIPGDKPPSFFFRHRIRQALSNVGRAVRCPGGTFPSAREISHRPSASHDYPCRTQVLQDSRPSHPPRNGRQTSHRRTRLRGSIEPFARQATGPRSALPQRTEST